MDFEIQPIDFSIDINFAPYDVISNTISYQETAPTNPRLNDLWTSTITLIQYQWIGNAWVNFNLQSLVNL
jgi:hypothetical protein